MNVIDICKEIYENRICPNCGGNFEMGECIYCGQVSEKVVKLIQDLESIIGTQEILLTGITPVYNYLYLLKDMKIDALDRIMDYDEYKKLIDDRLLDINKEKILYPDDIELIKFLVFYNQLDDNLNNKYISTLLKFYIEKQITMNRDELEKLIINFTQRFIGYATDYKRPKCWIGEEKKGTCGGALNDNVIISENLIDDFEKGKYLELFRTIFHECTHVRRFERNFKPNISYYDLMCLKDKILTDNDRKYYTDNYKTLFFEVEAFINEISETLVYCDNLKLQISDDEVLEMKTFRQYVYNEYFNKTERKVNGETMDLYEVFDRFIIDKPDLLKRYPSLNLEYKIDNGVVVKKSLDEIYSSVNHKDYIYKDEDLEYYLEYLNQRNKEVLCP